MGKRKSLKLNDQIFYEGSKHQVIEIEYPDVILKSLSSEMTEKRINYYILLTDPFFKFAMPTNQNTEKNDEKFIVMNGTLDTLSDTQREQVTRKYNLIKPLVMYRKAKRFGGKEVYLFMELFNKEYDYHLGFSELIQENIFDMISIKHKVSKRTLQRYLSSYEEYENSKSKLEGLVSRKHKKYQIRSDMNVIDIRHPKKHELVIASIYTYLKSEYCRLLEEVIKKYYLTKRQASIKEIFDVMEIKCHRHEPRLKPLSYDTIYGIIKRLDSEPIMRLRNSNEAANIYDPILHSFSNKEAMSALHIVEIDHTLLDIEVLDQNSMIVLGRPWLTLGIDVYSRCVWCMHLSFDSPSGDKVRKAIEQGVLFKKVQQQYNTINEWEVHGIPDIIYFDNGKEFDNHNIRKLIDEELESQVMYRPIGTPRWGGTIERLFGTLNTEFIHRMSGTTKSNVKAKGEYNSSKEAIYTLEDVNEYLIRYITDIYHHDIHTGILCTPYEKYIEGLNIGGQNDIVLPNLEDELHFKISILPYEELAYSRLGFRLANVCYNLTNLKHLLDRSKSKTLYKVKYDIDDISYVYVYDPIVERYVRLPATNPPEEVLKNMKRKTYQLIRKELKLKKKLMLNNIPDRDSLIEAKALLFESLEEKAKNNTNKVRAINHGVTLNSVKSNANSSNRSTQSRSRMSNELLGLVQNVNNFLKGEK